MKLVIEVSKGVVTNIEASGEISIYLIAHDVLEQSDGDTTDARQAFQPDFIGTEAEVMHRLEETLNEYDPAEY